MYKHILIPSDGSELSKKAVDHGIGLAKALNAKVTAVTVSEPFHIFAEISQGRHGCRLGRRRALGTD